MFQKVFQLVKSATFWAKLLNHNFYEALLRKNLIKILDLLFPQMMKVF